MQALSQAKLKVFAALHRKKARYQQHLYLAEGYKLVHQALETGQDIEAIVFTEHSHADELAQQAEAKGIPVFVADAVAWKRLSDMPAPEGYLAVVRMPPAPALPSSSEPTLLLYQLNDPGNLGTLLRTAHWFGYRHVVLSEGAVDWSNPKVVRASMGSVYRVAVHKAADFEGFVRQYAAYIIVADVSGKPLPAEAPPKRSWLLLGSESHGLPEAILQLPELATYRIQALGTQAESLNVAMAGSIMAYWHRGRTTAG